MKFVGDRAYDVAKAACPRLAEIKCYEQVCSGQSQYCSTILLLLNCTLPKSLFEVLFSS